MTPGNDAHLDDVFAGYLTCYETTWSAFADVEPAIAALATTTLKTAVLTNGAEEQQHAKLEAIGLQGQLGPVFTAEKLGAAKPDPSTYLTVCAYLGVHPSAALHVGDNHDLDVLAPRAAGLKPCSSTEQTPARTTNLTERTR
jgi:putative hydrolase of the HAD superfamily